LQAMRLVLDSADMDVPAAIYKNFMHVECGNRRAKLRRNDTGRPLLAALRLTAWADALKPTHLCPI
jgi:hypothetical protein